MGSDLYKSTGAFAKLDQHMLFWVLRQHMLLANGAIIVPEDNEHNNTTPYFVKHHCMLLFGGHCMVSPGAMLTDCAKQFQLLVMLSMLFYRCFTHTHLAM